MTQSRRGLRWLLLLATCLLLAGVFEAAARLWLYRIADEEQFLKYASLDDLLTGAGGRSFSKFSGHNYVGYVPTPGYERDGNRHDDRGYRGLPVTVPKLPGEFRIVALGGSTTYTSYAKSHEDAYPSQLERELHARGLRHVRVVNAGAPGYTTWESLINLQLRVLDLEPDMVIVYHAVNDVFARLVWPPEVYRGDNSGMVGLARGLDRDTPWHEHSAAIRILRIYTGASVSHAALERTFMSPKPTAFGWRFTRQWRDGSYPRGIFEKVPAERMLEVNRPIYFRRNVENMVVLAKHHGVVPVLTSFAYLADVPEVEGDPHASPVFVKAMDEHNAIMREIAAEQEVPFFDFAAVFPPDPSLYVGVVHVNARGARVKAELFADFLVGQGLIPARP